MERLGMPLNPDGEYDTANALVGDDLIEFVDTKLFPYLKKFKEVGIPKSIEVKIGVIFSEIRNRIQSGYNLRDILEQVDGLRFQTSEERHEMTYWYESRLNRMGNAGRNGGEYYTPRPLIRTIVKIVDPKIGKTVYDGACGSAGFLCEAYNYMHDKVTKTEDEKILQADTFTGKDDKALPYIIATMNMILHGVECPNIINTNTLTENLADVQEKDRFDYILANPPFGGKERAEVQQNFSIKTSETAYLFLEHFIKYLRAGGQAGIVIKNTFLSNTDNASIALRKKLLEECNLHTVLDLPSGVFQAGVKTVVLFYKKGEPTRKVWFYQLNLNRTLGKTDPLNEKDLAEFVELQKTKADSANSWSVSVADLNENFDLSPKNPNKVEVVDERTPEQIVSVIDGILNVSADKADRLIVSRQATEDKPKLTAGRLGDICMVIAGQSPNGSAYNEEGNGMEFHQGKKAFGKDVIEPSGVWTTEITKVAEAGDILMSVRAPVGPTNATDRQVCIGRGLAAIRCSSCALPQYILYSLRNIQDKITGKDGAVFNSINKDMIESLPIPSIDTIEQQRIIDLLDKEFAQIDALKNNAERLGELCDDLKQALLRKAFNGEL